MLNKITKIWVKIIKIIIKINYILTKIHFQKIFIYHKAKLILQIIKKIIMKQKYNQMNVLYYFKIQIMHKF